MTRWNILKDLIMSRDTRRAIGKAWPLFFFIIFNSPKSNKLITSYHDLETELKESPNTIKKWRDFLAKNKVME